jgi:hypothetical protein
VTRAAARDALYVAAGTHTTAATALNQATALWTTSCLLPPTPPVLLLLLLLLLLSLPLHQATLYTTSCLSSLTLASRLPSVLKPQLQTWSLCSVMVCTNVRLSKSHSFTCRAQHSTAQHGTAQQVRLQFCVCGVCVGWGVGGAAALLSYGLHQRAALKVPQLHLQGAAWHGTAWHGTASQTASRCGCCAQSWSADSKHSTACHSMAQHATGGEWLYCSSIIVMLALLSHSQHPHTFASLLAVANTLPSGCTATSSTHDS